MDVYRLNGKVDDLGLEEYYNKKGITIIEWADLIPDYLPEHRLDIKIRSCDDDENKRIITITPHGKKYEDLCEAVL
jgi:tRNA threonylcarbamoyladenosine biosynthesis protein TsaE